MVEGGANAHPAAEKGGASVPGGAEPDMPAQSDSEPTDRLIWRLARKQHGVVARWQLLPLGVTRHEIATRLASHRLIELHRGIYLVGAVPSEHAYAQAALLAMKGTGTLSHFSAAHIWKLRTYPPQADPWLTADLGGGLERPGIHVHRAALRDADIRTRHGLAVTSPPRTVLDCAALIADAYEYEALVAEVKFRGLASEKELRAQAERNARKRGVPLLREVLDLPGGPRRTRSRGERAFLWLLRQEGIDGYETNSKAFGPELDFVWPAERFAVEVDAWESHSGKVAFERDREKIAALGARGIQVMPVTRRQIETDRRRVANQVRSALRARAAP